MKKTALFAAAAALFAATPAAAQVGGHVGLGYTTTESSTDEESAWQLEGALGGASGSIGYQVDAGIGSIDFGTGDADSLTLAGHLYLNGGNWRLGGVIATANLDAAIEIEELVYGVEGTLNLGPNVVALASYTVGEVDTIVDVDTWNADFGLRFYVSDNLSISGALGFGNLDAGGTDSDTTSLGIRGEWQPWTAPVSLSLGYERFEVDGAFDEYDTLSFGVRWNFGGTLRERDNATPFETRTGLYQRIYGLQ